MREKINRWLELKRYNWKNLDISLLVVVSILLLISTYVLSIVQGDSFSLKRQLFGIIAGFVIVFIFVLIDYHDLCLYIPVIYIVTTLMAAATKFSPLGDDQGTDSYRWLDFKIIEFQPSEVCKIKHPFLTKDNLKNFKTFSCLCHCPGVTMFILVQSDLSSSIVMMVILIMMLANSGIGHKVLGPVAAVMIPVAGFLFWYIQQPGQKLLHGYQLKRIMGWLHPEEQALDTMFQQNNSILSIASGKLYGKMLDGTTTTRNYSKVDVTESDFIWTPIGEEFGFIGCMVILLLLSIIIIKCFIAAKNAKDYTGMMIAVGIGSMFCFQVFINIGVATRLLPNTGLPLPFLSNGLTSLLSYMIMIGILLNIGIQPNRGSGDSFEIH
ncbi:MAG: FtsW/RodA/SpoVE family cell cycle protein [Eubacterium sp.]